MKASMIAVSSDVWPRIAEKSVWESNNIQVKVDIFLTLL